MSIGRINIVSGGPLEGTAVNSWIQASRTAAGRQLCWDFFGSEYLSNRGGCYQCREGRDGVDINNISTYGNFCNVCCEEGPLRGSQEDYYFHIRADNIKNNKIGFDEAIVSTDSNAATLTAPDTATINLNLPTR